MAPDQKVSVDQDEQAFYDLYVVQRYETLTQNSNSKEEGKGKQSKAATPKVPEKDQPESVVVIGPTNKRTVDDGDNTAPEQPLKKQLKSVDYVAPEQPLKKQLKSVDYVKSNKQPDYVKSNKQTSTDVITGIEDKHDEPDSESTHHNEDDDYDDDFGGVLDNFMFDRPDMQQITEVLFF